MELTLETRHKILSGGGGQLSLKVFFFKGILFFRLFSSPSRPPPSSPGKASGPHLGGGLGGEVDVAGQRVRLLRQAARPEGGVRGAAGEGGGASGDARRRACGCRAT